MQSKSKTISVLAAAKMIGVTKQAVRDLIRKGELPGWAKLDPDEPNSAFVGPLAAVEAYIARREQKKAE